MSKGKVWLCWETRSLKYVKVRLARLCPASPDAGTEEADGDGSGLTHANKHHGVAIYSHWSQDGTTDTLPTFRFASPHVSFARVLFLLCVAARTAG